LHRYERNKLVEIFKDVTTFEGLKLTFNGCRYQLCSSVRIEWCL